jgi:parvulin-like peptidyl-prolyl isomerase
MATTTIGPARRFAPVLAALVFALVLGSALAQAEPNRPGALPSSVDPNEPVIQLGGGETVTQQEFAEEFDRAMRGLAMQQGLPYTAETRELFDRFRAEFLDMYATQRALLLEAEQRGLEVTDDEIDRDLTTAQGAMSDEEFDTLLRDLGYQDRATYREAARRGLAAQRVADELRGGIVPTDEEIQTYYDLHRTRYFEDRALDEVRPQVQQRFVGERLNEQFRELRMRHGIETFPDRVWSPPAAAPSN